MPDSQPTVTGQQAAEAQTALRRALGLEPERFPAAAFVGMLSDEIEQLRAAGKSDTEIAGLIESAVGVKLSAEMIRDNYAPPEARGRHGD